MSESWRDLVRPFGDVQPSTDLLPGILEREAARSAKRRSYSGLHRVAGWALAGVGVLLVVGALALAAHSRRDSPAANAPPVLTGAVTVTGRVVTEGGPPVLPGQSDINPVRFARLVVSGTTTTGVHVSQHLRADTDGQFALALPPGVYTVTAVIYPPASRALAKQPHVRVTVKGGRPLHVQIKEYVF
ncbi:MAG: hypothetical protein QOI39_510 [Mycobacterium sp.]|nr:hypothetical protein [Mycobacterium sp.]